MGHTTVTPTTQTSASHRPSNLTAALSQYGILKNVCNDLSSAGIVHLSAACKEHRIYITSSQPVLEGLVAKACCDGSGVRTRATKFDHWDGDVKEALTYCRGTEARVCVDCKAKVCQVDGPDSVPNDSIAKCVYECRFHVFYGVPHGGVCRVSVATSATPLMTSLTTILATSRKTTLMDCFGTKRYSRARTVKVEIASNGALRRSCVTFGSIADCVATTRTALTASPSRRLWNRTLPSASHATNTTLFTARPAIRPT